MTRIIAGVAGGIRLRVPGSGTRPTSDRVRESLFASLEASGVLDRAHILDLYAGSGALGLEALSRDGQSAVLVERSRPAAAIIRENARAVRKALGSDVAVTVHEGTVRGYLGIASATATLAPFDLVFVDPPYDISDDELNGDLQALTPLLSADALVVVERGKRAHDPAAPGLEITRHRSYGDTAVWWLQPAAESQSR